MKRIIWLSLFIFSGFLTTGQSIADYTVYYDFISISDTVKNTFLTPQEFILYKVGQESRFMSSANYFNDSIVAVFSETYPESAYKSEKARRDRMDFFYKTVKPNTRYDRLNYKIIKVFETGNFILLYPFSLPDQYLEETMNFEWEITSELDTILGLSCTKAITNYGGRRYYAWFTSEVPINDGPYVFQGLPGLILKIMDDKGYYTFTINNIITEKTDRFWKPNFILNKNSRKIDRKTYVDKMTDYQQNPRLPASVLNLTEEDRLKLKERYAERFDLLIERY